MGRAAVHGNRLSEGVLSTLSWLFEVLSALGVGAVSKFEEHQQQGGRGRDVKLGAGRDMLAGNRIDPRPVLIVTGLVQEARIAAGPGMIVICSSSDPQQCARCSRRWIHSTFRGVICFRRRRWARSVAEVWRRGRGDRGLCRRYPLSGWSGAQRGNDRQRRAWDAGAWSGAFWRGWNR